MSLSPGQLAALRREYSKKGLHRAALDPDPVRQFTVWLAEALEIGLCEPNAMVLATVDAAHRPWTRTVLLKACDARGFTFFTNYEGDKAQQIAANSQVGATFLWVPLERQVNITGRAEKVSREESAAYFASRPRKSQLGAWASKQSEVVENREQLQRQLKEIETRFGEGDIPLPPDWGGYCIRPQTVEFWQGRASRLHDRFRYARARDGDWIIDRLSP